MDRPDQHELDEGLMDELGGAMDDFDSKKFMPIVQVTVSVSKDGKAEPAADEGAMPTPEEMAELEKTLG